MVQGSFLGRFTRRPSSVQQPELRREAAARTGGKARGSGSCILITLVCEVYI